MHSVVSQMYTNLGRWFYSGWIQILLNKGEVSFTHINHKNIAMNGWRLDVMKCMPLPLHLVHLVIMSQSLLIAGKIGAKQEFWMVWWGLYEASATLSKVGPVFSHLTSHLKNTFVMTKRCKTKPKSQQPIEVF